MSDAPRLSPASYEQLRFAGRTQSRQSSTTVCAPRPLRNRGGLSAKSPQQLVDGLRVAQQVLATAKLDIDDYRAGPLMRRTAAMLRSLRVSTLREAQAQLAARPAVAQRALQTLLIGHTGAFRDPEVFDALRRLAHVRFSRLHRPLRIWSVGCSQGDELLSAALLLSTCPPLEIGELRGSDCRPRAVQLASRRCQAFWQTVPPSFAWLQDRTTEQDFCRLAAGADWRQEDALRCETDGPWDLILCRNVTIYMQPHAGEWLWRRLTESLAPSGLLVAGKVERPQVAGKLRRLTRCLYEPRGTK